MEIIFELVAEVAFEFLGEAVLKRVWLATGGRVPGRAWAVLTVGLLGLFGGFFWGLHVADLGRGGPPRAMWVSLGLAAALAAAATARRSSGGSSTGPVAPTGPVTSVARLDRIGAALAAGHTTPGPEAPVGHFSFADRVLPWRWSASRLYAFAGTNAAVAAGMALGYVAT